MARAALYLTLGALVGVGLGGVTLAAKGATGVKGVALYKREMDAALSRDDFVDEPDVTKINEAGINSMLAALDPHSNYLDPKQLGEFQTTMKGEEFGGLGLEVMQESGFVKVVSPIDDTPAARIGMLANDVIVKIDDTDVQGLSLKEAVDRMRGPANTPVRLTVQRGANHDAKVFTIVREIIHVQPVRSRIEGGDVGYIRITQFNQQAYDSVRAALAKFKTGPGAGALKGYIVDLRNNPGGLLTQSIEIANAFVEDGDIVSTRGRYADQTQTYSARPGFDLSEGKPVVVLINGGSASASEIVAGALQDLHRASLIGTRSFGKGSVQTVLPLGDNGALKLTTARYYTPSGRSIQAKGIVPDYRVLENIPDDLKGKVASRGEASLTGHLKNGDDEKTGSDAYVPPDVTKDTQLIAAVNLLHGNPPPKEPETASTK